MTFLKRIPLIERITWKNDHIITLQMKDKTIKTYNFWNEKAKKVIYRRNLVMHPGSFRLRHLPPEPPKKAIH